MSVLYNSIIELITKQINEKGWTTEDDNTFFKLELYPFEGICKYKVRFMETTIIKTSDNKYQSVVKLENTNFCMLTVEEEDNYYEDKEDFSFFYFKSEKLPDIKEAILFMINTLVDIKKCSSCNRLYDSKDLDKNDICLHCLLESIIQEKDECIICMDTELPKIHYQLNCGHKFHFGCIIKLKKLQCPLCRKPFILKR